MKRPQATTGTLPRHPAAPHDPAALVQQSIGAADKIEALAASLANPTDKIRALGAAAKLRQNAAKILGAQSVEGRQGGA